MTPGLYQKIESLLYRKRHQESTAVNPGLDPAVQHSAVVNARFATTAMQSALEAAMENRLLITKLDEILNQLTSSPHTSRHRSLVIEKLEEAQDRLRRELGPEEEMGDRRDRGSEMGGEEI